MIHFPCTGMTVHALSCQLAKLLHRHRSLQIGTKHRLYLDKRFITIAPMLDHETGDEKEVNVKIVLVEIFQGGEYIKYLLASPSLREEGPTFRTLFWHLITFRHFENFILLL